MLKGNEFFYISGYWKDTKEKFENYFVTSYNYDDYDNYDEDYIFYFGLSEKDIIEAIEQGINSDYEFVITSYEVTE